MVALGGKLCDPPCSLIGRDTGLAQFLKGSA